MPRAAALVRDAGGVFIADEVQAGFCRTGRWWGYEATGFDPDIVTMGKPMGNGLPVAGVAARGELVDRFRSECRYFNTYAASPLQAAVGMAVLDVLEDEALAENAARTGTCLMSELRSLMPRFEHVGDVRGHGLFCGIEWVRDRDTRTPDAEGAIDVVNRLKERGFLISNARGEPQRAQDPPTAPSSPRRMPPPSSPSSRPSLARCTRRATAAESRCNTRPRAVRPTDPPGGCFPHEARHRSRSSRAPSCIGPRVTSSPR